jgi:hypothetical protein
VKASDVVVVTITLARTHAEERALRKSLEKLSATGFPIIIADGGSSERFVKELRTLCAKVVSPAEKGLVPQVKAGLSAALHQWPNKPGILYTEPDKYPFFAARMQRFIARVRASARFGVAAAARISRSFRTFPEGQQVTERFMSEAFSWIVGEKGDYCYGPLLLSRRAAEIALTSPDELGWGWRFWTMRKATDAGLQVLPITLDLPCPQEQRREDSLKDRLYRLKQLKQNLEAVISRMR